MKTDLYRLIHKAQRQQLFDLSIKIGKCDFSNKNQYLEIKESLQKIIAHLYKHSKIEDKFIHPLYNIFADELELINTQHDILEEYIDRFSNLIIEEQLTSSLYEDFNSFLVVYLSHIEEEEKLQKAILWKYYTEDYLMAVMKRFQESLSPEQVVENLIFMMPSLSEHEATIMINNAKNSVSSEVFKDLNKIMPMPEWVLSQKVDLSPQLEPGAR